MRFVGSPWVLGCLGVLIILTVSVLGSPNIALWIACVFTLPLAVFIAGGKDTVAVLLWLIAINWLSIFGDVVSADLAGRELSEGWSGSSVFSESWLLSYRVTAILLSLCGLTVIALGMRSGSRLIWQSSLPVARASFNSGKEIEGQLNVQRIVLCYFASLAIIQPIYVVANFVPALKQPLLALDAVKFVFIYLIAKQVFEANRGYKWLILLSTLEIVVGLSGFFASYKEAFFIMLIAMASSRKAPSIGVWMFGITTVVVMVWISLVWTISKKEYRYQQFSNPVEQRLEWMARRFFIDKIDYHKAAVEMFERVGYTEFFSIALAKADAGSLPDDLHFYATAAQRLLMPRFLFPDKSDLNDTRTTTAVLGVKFDNDTSVGIGYMAQAYIDFGWPGFLVPLWLIGFVLGGLAKYFMTRAAPLMIQQSITTAALFTSFRIETNIEKALGGMVMVCLVMGLVLKFGYPIIARWLVRSPPASLGPVRDYA